MTTEYKSVKEYLQAFCDVDNAPRLKNMGPHDLIQKAVSELIVFKQTAEKDPDLLWTLRCSLGNVLGYTVLTLNKLNIDHLDMTHTPFLLEETGMDRAYDAQGFDHVWSLALHSIATIAIHINTRVNDPAEVDELTIAESAADLAYILSTVVKRKGMTLPQCLCYALTNLTQESECQG